MKRNTQAFLPIPFVENTGAVIVPTIIPPSTVALVRAITLAGLAMSELGATERYSLERLAGELQRQTLKIAMEGGANAEQQRQIRSLVAACAAELRAVNEQLDDQLTAILTQA